jgi:uncharacterized protein YdaU (DUF1376 family)
MMQHGAYRLLIDEYMVHGPLPNDLQRLYRICAAFSAEERASVEFILAEFFQIKGPAWLHKRCDSERSWQESKSEAARDSIMKRWLYERNTNVEQTNYQRNTNQNQNQNQNHNQNQNQNQKKPWGDESPQPPLLTDRPRKTRAAAVPKSAAVWDAYAMAYFDRYGVAPARNAKANSMLAQLVDRLGAEEAPHVAAFYVGHQRAQYVAGRHPISLLLRDAEGLRTDWATRRQITEFEAREGDKRAAQGNVWNQLIEESRAKS